jgi:hypothetical protein
VCDPNDKDPWIRFDLEEPVKARRIRFSPANSSFAMRDYYGDIHTLAYRINDGKRIEHTLSSVFADSTGKVHIRATGTNKMTFWIEGFDVEVLAEFDEKGGPWNGLRVVKVEYYIDGELVATVAGDPEQPWSNERYDSQFTFDLPGEHTLQVQAKVTVVDPEGDPKDPSQREVLESVSLKIQTDYMVPSIVRLKKRTTIESIEILVLDKTADKSVGFSAIELLD